MKRAIHPLLALAVIAASLISGLSPAPHPVLAASSELFISEYVHGSTYSQALEIYNGTASVIDLAANGYAFDVYYDGETTARETINLTGTVAAGDVYVVAHQWADPAIISVADQLSLTGWFSGNDTVVLKKGTTTLDVIGQIGFDPGLEWGSGLTSTRYNTLRRKPTILQGDTDSTNTFNPALEWDGFGKDIFGGLGSHDTVPLVMSAVPVDKSVGASTNSTINITFSEPVSVSSASFTISCTRSQAHPYTITGGPEAFTLIPDVIFQLGDVCTVTVVSGQVSDVDAVDPPDTLPADYTVTFTVGYNTFIPMVRFDTLCNGNFEAGSSCWTQNSSTGRSLITQTLPPPVTPHSGTWAAWLGGVLMEKSYIEQVVTIPSSAPQLAFWHWIISDEECGYDREGVLINSVWVDYVDLCTNTNTSSWKLKMVDLSAYKGQTVLLRILADTDSVNNSNLFIDDIHFQAAAPP